MIFRAKKETCLHSIAHGVITLQQMALDYGSERRLENLGYRVLAAAGGHSAIEKADSGATIDMLLVDIAMPEITGTEVMQAVLKKRPALPYLYDGYVGHAKLDPTVQRILKKPFAELAAKAGRNTVFAPSGAARAEQCCPHQRAVTPELRELNIKDLRRNDFTPSSTEPPVPNVISNGTPGS